MLMWLNAIARVNNMSVPVRPTVLVLTSVHSPSRPHTHGSPDRVGIDPDGLKLNKKYVHTYKIKI